MHLQQAKRRKYYYCNVTVSKNGYTETTTTNCVKVRVTTPLSHATIGSIAAQTYTGKGITPSVTVKYNGITLTNGTDYTVSYSNHINPGTATVTITGKGYYTGSMVINFTIKEIKTAGYMIMVNGITIARILSRPAGSI